MVIPCKDDAVLLRRCLTLLAAQTVSPHEVVVVDNGSTDDSAAVARGAGAVVVPEPRPGIPAAAAAGYDATRGEVIARLDADSAPPPDWIARVQAALADPSVVAVTGPGRFDDVPPRRSAVLSRLYLGTYFTSMHAALGHPVLFGSNLAVRRSAWLAVRDRVRRDDPELHDDADLSAALGAVFGGAALRVDRSLVVGMSSRCLRGRAQWRRRVDRGMRTVRLAWADTGPGDRWLARARAAAARGNG